MKKVRIYVKDFDTLKVGDTLTVLGTVQESRDHLGVIVGPMVHDGDTEEFNETLTPFAPENIHETPPPEDEE